MFMRRNRATNGAPQPEQTMAATAPKQRAARKLQPNEAVPAGEDWRFNPDMGSCMSINNKIYDTGISGAGRYGTSYENDIPHVGGPEFDHHHEMRKR